MHGWLPLVIQIVTATVLMVAIGRRSGRWVATWLPVAVLAGGAAAFGAELVARLSDESRAKVEELAAKEESEGLSLEIELEQLRLLWPSYFADPVTAPEMPPVRMAPGSSEGLWGEIVARLPDLEAALPSVAVPVGVLVGGGSPMPTTFTSTPKEKA